MIFTHLFWILVCIILYSYIGYPLLLWLITLPGKPRRIGNGNDFLPEITIAIAAYNERDIVEEKVRNTLSVNYPHEKMKQLWVTDGSTDGTPEALRELGVASVLHSNERLGKAAAVSRAMAHVTTPITIFSDANTLIHPDALAALVQPFKDPGVGCVAGEKKVLLTGNTSATGEGIYWRYESLVKRLESASGSTLSAAGELFAIRTELYPHIAPDTILDDFEISTQIALRGYSVKYAPRAVSSEKGSASMEDERKRKIRIAAGGFQTLVRNPALLNPFKHPALTFKYLSHKVFRWTIVPLAVLLLPVANLGILLNTPWSLYTAFFALLVLLYLLGLTGYILRNSRRKLPLFALPRYLIMIHAAQLQGFARYAGKRQSAKWEKVKRET